MEPEAPEIPTMIRLGACAMRPPARHGTPADWLGLPRMTGGAPPRPPPAALPIYQVYFPRPPTTAMPIYEFYCRPCHRVFSFLSRAVDTARTPSCPRCGAPELVRRV